MICDILLALWVYVISEQWFQYTYFSVFKKQENLSVSEWCAVPQNDPGRSAEHRQNFKCLEKKQT